MPSKRPTVQGEIVEIDTSDLGGRTGLQRVLADFYRRIWGRGPAGAQVPLKVLQGSRVREVTVRSIDRIEYFRPSKTY